MKHIITLIFLWTLLSCTGRAGMQCNESGGGRFQDSKTVDARCEEIMSKADDEAEASGFCYVGPLLKGADPGAIDPDPEKCSAFYEEARKKCEALPPISERPEDLEYLSGGGIYEGNKLVVKDGKPVCP